MKFLGRYDPKEGLVLEYPMGSICKDPGSSRVAHESTKILFACDKGRTRSEPVFFKRENCTYFFTWEHQAACGIPQVGTVLRNTLQMNNCDKNCNGFTGWQYGRDNWRQMQSSGPSDRPHLRPLLSPELWAVLQIRQGSVQAGNMWEASHWHNWQVTMPRQFWDLLEAVTSSWPGLLKKMICLFSHSTYGS